MTHDPKQSLIQLQALLSSPSKKIGFLFGAGISCKDKEENTLIPKVDEMTTQVVNEFKSDPQKKAIENIKKEITDSNKEFNIESLLSKISEKERAAGNEKLCGLTKEELLKLRSDIEKKIQEIVSVHESLDITKTNHHTFAQWIKNANRDFSVEVFTINYDYLLEQAFEKEKVPYFDGFVGSYNAFFFPEWIENDSPVRDWTKLWKIHGSLGWDQNETREIIRTSYSSGKSMIYPSFLKYDHSRKQPYLSYMDRLSNFLRQDDSVLFICGYSFGDEHINDMILSSLTRTRSSHVFVLKRGEIKEEDILSSEIAMKNFKISVLAQNAAVIGGKFGEWQLMEREEVPEFFDTSDSASASAWTGKGKFLLGDFKSFTEFLSSFYKSYHEKQ